MKLDRSALRTACFAAARNVMWARRPIDVASIDAVAQQFLAIAEAHEEFVESQGRDPNLIVRAARYLAETHAIPPMRESTSWFHDMLAVLIELACPNSAGAPAHEPLYRDIEQGLAVARGDHSHADPPAL